jgi:hypothetical protein
LLPLYRWLASTVSRPQKAPRLSFFALQHFRNQGPFFSLPLLRKRLGGFALSPKSSALRVWLPSRRSQAPRSLGDLFQPPTLVGFSLRSFSPLEWSVAGLPAPFRPCTFLQNLPALDRCSDELSPPRSRVPCPPSFYVGAGPFAPLGFGASQALPPLGPGKNRLLSYLPLSFFALLNLTIEETRNLRGSSPERLGSLPPKRAPACMAFPPYCISHLFERCTCR